MSNHAHVNPSAEQLLACFADVEHVSEPYDYWLLTDPLPDQVCDGIAALPFAPPAVPVFDGRRESNNSVRVHFSPQIQAAHAVCREVADAFKDARVKARIEAMTGTRLAESRLRIEYCQDTDGFWLEPHVDIPVKLFTMLVYLSDDPDLYDAGTDVYDASPEHKLVATAPFAFNTGMIFIPGRDTWHGFSKRPIKGVRKSIIINYVKPDWRAVAELA